MFYTGYPPIFLGLGPTLHPVAGNRTQAFHMIGCQPIAGHTHTPDNLEMLINLPCTSLDWERKPEYPEKTPEAQGEHANSTHTAEAGIEPPTLEV
ncbi:hypothetical protein QTP86_015973 [Hemibagrus guttatus]|nr:hypothetical protein QTP86_015973 [Hemibagrus guttatus]